MHLVVCWTYTVEALWNENCMLSVLIRCHWVNCRFISSDFTNECFIMIFIWIWLFSASTVWWLIPNSGGTFSFFASTALWIKKATTLLTLQSPRDSNFCRLAPGARGPARAAVGAFHVELIVICELCPRGRDTHTFNTVGYKKCQLIICDNSPHNLTRKYAELFNMHITFLFQDLLFLKDNRTALGHIH